MAFSRKLICFSAVFVVALFVFAEPASAHSELVSTNPAAESTLAKSPKTIDLVFSENVELSFGSLRLYDETGKRINTSKPEHHGGDTVRVKPTDLKNGTYVVAWNVVSADSHPVRGAFTFSVGKASTSSDTYSSDAVEKLLSSSKTSSTVRIGFSSLRFLIFLCLALIIGIISMRYFVVKSSLSPPVNYIFNGALVLLGVLSIASIGFQAAVAGQFSLSQAFSWEVFNQERTTHFGEMQLLRVLMCIAMILIWHFARGRMQKIGLLIVALALAITPALTGHASAGDHVVLAFINDVIHVLAASIWFGGLLVLPFLLSRPDRTEITSKFSKIALGCVIAIAATGVFAWWRQVGSYNASVSTWFGQLINIKTFVFIVVVVVAFYSRSHVRRLSANNDDVTNKRLVKLVYLESALLIVVMIATSIVVSAVPARTALALPVTKHLEVKSALVDVSIDPAKAGPVVLHVYVLKENGTPYALPQDVNRLGVPAVSATWMNKDRDVGPIAVNLRFAGLNHFIAESTKVPFSGTWTLTVRLRLSEFDEQVTSTEVTIR